MQKRFVFLRICIYICIIIYKTSGLDNTIKKLFWGNKKMDQIFLNNMKERLLEQRNTILSSLVDQSEDMKVLIKTVESGDEADVAADVIDRTLLTALGTQDANRLQQIDNALDRINQNRYGHCIKCGKEIPQERLEVLPYALMCVSCASAEERKNR